MDIGLKELCHEIIKIIKIQTEGTAAKLSETLK